MCGNDPQILLTDVTGKTIRKIDITGAEIHIDMNGLAQGVYLVKYSDDSQSQTIRVNKQ